MATQVFNVGGLAEYMAGAVSLRVGTSSVPLMDLLPAWLLRDLSLASGTGVAAAGVRSLVASLPAEGRSACRPLLTTLCGSSGSH